MNFKQLKTYQYFWIVSAIILIIGFFKSTFTEDSTFYINIYDTYYVIENVIVTVILTICYFLLGVGYWFVEKILMKDLVRTLTQLHSTILIGGFFAYWLVLGYQKLFERNSFPLFDYQDRTNQTLMIVIFLIITVAQPAYFINLIIGIFRRKKPSASIEDNDNTNP